MALPPSNLPTAVITQLQQLVKSDPNARSIFRRLAAMERPRKETDLYRLRYDLLGRGDIHLSCEQMDDVFRKIQKLGAGKLTPKRPPYHSSFAWLDNQKSTALAALGMSPDDAPHPTPRVTSKKAVAGRPERVARSGAIIAVLPFQDDYISIEVPKGLTEKDALEIGKALAAWTRAQNR